MKTNFTLLFITLLCYALNAQPIFQMPARPITVGSEDVEVSIPYSIPGASFTQDFQIDFTSPTENHIALHSGYLFKTPRSVVLRGPNNRDTLVIKFLSQSLGSASATLTITGTYTDLAAPGVHTPFTSTALNINYLSAPAALVPALPANLYGAYNAMIATIDAEYVCVKTHGGPSAKAVQYRVLDSNLLNVFTNVVIGSNDIIKTGTAASIVQDKDKGTVNFNSSFLASSGTSAMNIGLRGKSSGGFYNIFGNTGWYKEIGLDFGTTKIFRGKQRFWPNECGQLKLNRDTSYSRLLAEYNETINEPIDLLNADLRRIDNALSSASLAALPISKAEFELLSSKRRELQQRIKRYKKIALDVVSAGTIDNVAIRKNIEDALYDYDKANDVLTGYSFNWVDGKVGISHNTINLNADSIPDNTIKKEIADKGLIKFTIQGSWNRTVLSNYHPNKKGILQFIQFNGLIERGSFLDIPGMVEKPIISIKQSPNFQIIDSDNGETLGYVNNITKGLWSFTPGFYYGFFGGKGQQIGWDFRSNFRILLNKIDGSEVKNTYSIFSGPVFRIAGEKDFSKATIGIKGGLANAPVGTSRLWKDYFTVRLEVGVPFKWYYKEK